MKCAAVCFAGLFFIGFVHGAGTQGETAAPEEAKEDTRAEAEGKPGWLTPVIASGWFRIVSYPKPVDREVSDEFCGNER